MKYIIGLGNPGNQYHNTRHNVGFMLLDMIFDDWKEDKKHTSLVSMNSNNSIPQQGIMGVKPQTFMNLSGEAISSLVSYYKLDPKKDLLIISDDIDMEFGKVRFRSEGSHGGQNGLRNTIEKIGTNEFSRIKIGIGRNELYSVSDWVLSRFTPDEQKKIESEVFEKVQEYIKKWLGDSINIL